MTAVSKGNFAGSGNGGAGGGFLSSVGPSEKSGGSIEMWIKRGGEFCAVCKEVLIANSLITEGEYSKAGKSNPGKKDLKEGIREKHVILQKAASGLTSSVNYPMEKLDFEQVRPVLFAAVEVCESIVGKKELLWAEEDESMEIVLFFISLIVDKQLVLNGKGGLQEEDFQRMLLLCLQSLQGTAEKLKGCSFRGKAIAGRVKAQQENNGSKGLAWVIINCLKALGAIVNERSSMFSEYYSQMLKAESGILIELCSFSSLTDIGWCEAEIRRLACVCIGNLFVKASGSITTKYADISCEALIANITHTGNRHLDRSRYNRFMNSAFRGLLNVVTSAKNVSSRYLSTLMALLKEHMLYGLSQSMLVHSECPFGVPKEAITSVFEPLSDKMVKLDAKHASKYVPKYRNNMSSSGSELSEVEVGASKKHKATLTVRLSAHQCLQAVLKNAPKKDVYGYWPSFIPDSARTLVPTLFTSIIHDPSPKVRAAGVASLMGFLENSRQFLSSADDQNSDRSFTSLSRTLGLVVHALHEQLAAAIEYETENNVLIMLFRCFALLVVNCPYSRLRSGLRSKIVPLCVSNYFKNKEQNVKVATLTCLGALFSLERSEEVSKCIDQFVCAANNDLPEGNSSLFSVVLGFLDRSHPVPIRLEAHQVITSILKCYFEEFFDCSQRLLAYVKSHLGEEDVMVKYYSLKVLEEYAKAIGEQRFLDQKVFEKCASTFWNDLLDSYVDNLLEDQSYLVRSAVIDCISSLNETVLSLLGSERKVHLLNWASAGCVDENASVRAAGCRALGVYCNIKAFKEDILCLTDIGTTLNACWNDDSINVKIKSTWAIANLAEAMIYFFTSAQAAESNFFPSELIMNLVHCSLQCSKASDKLKTSSVRALGSFGRLLKPEMFDQAQVKKALDNCCDSLVRNMTAGSVKVRWNACHGLGNLLKNESISFEKSSSALNALKGLLSVIKDSNNFKVRINAVAALFAVNTRERFGHAENIDFILNTLLSSHSNIDQIEDFSEFQYKSTLQRHLQLCFLYVFTYINEVEMKEVLRGIQYEKNEIYNILCSAKTMHVDYLENKEKFIQESPLLALLSSEKIEKSFKKIHSCFESVDAN